MSLFSKLFGKKKKEERKVQEVDGQEQFFKEGEKAKKSSPEAMVKTEDHKKTVVVKVHAPKEAPKVEAKKAEPAKTAPAAKPAVPTAKPAPVKAAAPAKKPAEVKPAKEEIPEEKDISLDDEEVTVTDGGKPVRNGQFDIRKSKDGRFYFNLYASNKAVIAYSQMYVSIGSAMNGIKSVVANATKAPIEDTTLKKPDPKTFPKWEIYIDKAGEHRFRLYASNGSCICHSHGYASKSSCKGGIESIQRFASDNANINKAYLNK